MTNQELQEIFELLEKSGMNPRLCDTPVPFYENGVVAGIPTDPGDIMRGEYVLMPRDLVGLRSLFATIVRGDSMRDAGFVPGDKILVQVDTEVSDGDIVIASIDGESTLKAFYTDGKGQKWLVPFNDAYDPIVLKEEMNVRIVGKVVEHTKEMPRASYSDCINRIKRATEREAVNRERIEETVRRVAQYVRNGRQWYAVYRALLDHKAISGDYVCFVELIGDIVPDHPHLPRAIELQRVAVQSFRKSVVRWERDDAPVTGARYDDYLRIARMAAETLRG